MKSATTSTKKLYSFTGVGSVLFALAATAAIFSPWIQERFGTGWTYTSSGPSWIFALPVQALTPLGPLAVFTLAAMTLFCACAWATLFSNPLALRR